MRDIIFIVVLLVLASFAYYDATAGRTIPLSIDMILIAFALVSWRPWKRPR